MKKLLALAALIVAAASLNAGCTASVGVKPTGSATRLNTARQAAYVTPANK